MMIPEIYIVQMQGGTTAALRQYCLQFAQSAQRSARMVSQFRPPSLHPLSFPIPYSSVTYHSTLIK